MSYTLDGFSADCRRLLAAEPGAPGREKVRALLEKVLLDDEFITTHLGDDVPDRKILYQDPQLGFCICAHFYQGAKESQPHDHGPSWAIYGQARGETVMSDFALIEPPAESRPGTVRRVRSYALKPGMAHLYNEGDLHAPRRESSTKLIRIEGENLEKVRRKPYRCV